MKLVTFQNHIVVEKTQTKVELDLPNYATKSDLKSATDIDTSKFAKKTDLAGPKSHVDKLDIDKSETTPIDLSKLRLFMMNW